MRSESFIGPNLQARLWGVKHRFLLTDLQEFLYSASMKKKNPLVELAIQIAGSQAKLAALIGGRVKQQHVQLWLYMPQVPASRAIQIEIATNGVVSRHELRPDLWPPPPGFEPPPPEDRRRNPPNAASQKTGEAGGARTARKPRQTAGSGEASIEQAA